MVRNRPDDNLREWLRILEWIEQQIVRSSKQARSDRAIVCQIVSSDGRSADRLIS